MNYGEPWRLESGPGPGHHTPAEWYNTIIDGEGGEVCDPAHVADAERIVACVNALAGLDPAGLDDVLEALEMIAAWKLPTPEYETDYGSNGVREHMRGLAVAALAALDQKTGGTT